MNDDAKNLDTVLPDTVFDYEGLKERLMGDDSFVKLVVDTFTTHFPDQLSSLQSALEKADATMVKRQAHAIKGASINAGALIIHHIAADIEILGEAGDLEKVGPLLSQLPSQFESFELEFKKHFP